MILWVKLLTAFKAVTSNIKSIFDMVVNNGDKIKKACYWIIGAYAVFCICYTSYHLFSIYYLGRGNEHIDDKFEPIRVEQQQAITNIQSATDRLTETTKTIRESSNTATRITNGLGEVIERARPVPEIIEDSQRRISECKEILNRARP